MPKLLDAQMIDSVCDAINAVGEYAPQALVRFGASKTLAEHWMARGEDLEHGESQPTTDLDDLCLALYSGVVAAEAEYEKRMITIWQQCLTEPRADLMQKKAALAKEIGAKLATRFPDRYKRAPAERAQPALSWDDEVRRRSSTSTRAQ